LWRVLRRPPPQKDADALKPAADAGSVAAILLREVAICVV